RVVHPGREGRQLPCIEACGHSSEQRLERIRLIEQDAAEVERVIADAGIARGDVRGIHDFRLADLDEAAALPKQFQAPHEEVAGERVEYHIDALAGRRVEYAPRKRWAARIEHVLDALCAQ